MSTMRIHCVIKLWRRRYVDSASASTSLLDGDDEALIQDKESGLTRSDPLDRYFPRALPPEREDYLSVLYGRHLI